MKDREIKLHKVEMREFYRLNSLLGNDWAMFYILIGGRETGKSYSVTECYVNQYKRYHRPFYWMRLTDTSKRKLLMNNAEKLVDPDLRRKYSLDLTTLGDNVYNILERDKKGKIKRKELMCRVLDLATFYNDKGSGLFDKDFLNDPNMYYNICLDEMNREANEKKSFDIVYAFVNQLENLIRSTKKRVRIICIGNLLEEASDILCAFNFLPEKYGRYYLKKKRCVIEYIKENEAYKKRREGTVSDILMPNCSTFTNEIKTDNSLVNKKRCVRPTMIIKFSKSKSDWFTVWDGNIIHKWNKENISLVLPMRPYLDERYQEEAKNNIIEGFNMRVYTFKDLITFKQFQQALSLLKPSR